MAAGGCESPLPDPVDDAKEPIKAEDASAESASTRLEAWRDVATAKAEDSEAKALAAREAVENKLREIAKNRLRAALPKTPKHRTEFEQAVGAARTPALRPKQGSDGKEYLDRLEQAEAEPRKALLNALGNAAAAEGVAADAERLHKEFWIPSLDRDHVAERNSLRIATAGRLALVSSALAAAWLPLVVSRWWKRRELRVASKQCPQCLAKGRSLQEFDSGQVDYRDRPIRGYKCTACSYQFEKSFARFVRSVFPTVGLPQSGKTRWLLSFYHKVSMNELPRGATVLNIPLALNADLNTQVHQTVILGNAPEPTRVKRVEPLVFFCKERRRGFEGFQFLVNLFDYSGEIMAEPAYQQILQRAINCNGCLLFLDPMNPDLFGQYELLTQFLNTLATFRGKSTGECIDIPVAVCVTKLDCLVHSSSPLAHAHQWLAELNKSAEEPLNLRTIRWRSDHIAAVADQIFMGGSLKHLLASRFGSRVMLFPMSAIGIDENCLATMSTNPPLQPNQSPFGILEPFYWLLYMNGYNVFE